MRQITLYTKNHNADFFIGEAKWLYKEAEDYGYGEEEFLFIVEPDYDNSGITRLTIAEPEMWVEVRDEWIEFKYSHILRDYAIATNDIISMEIEF